MSVHVEGRLRTSDDGPDGRWPSSPLAAVGRAFELLVKPPTAYTLAPAQRAGLAFVPGGFVDLPGVRRWLLSPQASPAARDDVWREIVIRSRRPGAEGQAWTVIAAGMALPGLIAAAGRLTRGFRGETADVDAEVLAGFVARLRSLDVEDPACRRVVGRLVDAGIRAGRTTRDRALDPDRTGDPETVHADCSSGPSARHWDHPDWVLVRAVDAGVLDRTEARLIGATRLEDVPLATAAAALRIDPDLAVQWRRRAECRLRDAVHAGELDAGHGPGPQRPKRRRRVARVVAGTQK